jgi:hypothetical protein
MHEEKSLRMLVGMGMRVGMREKVNVLPRKPHKAPDDAQQLHEDGGRAERGRASAEQLRIQERAQ